MIYGEGKGFFLRIINILCSWGVFLLSFREFSLFFREVVFVKVEMYGKSFLVCILMFYWYYYINVMCSLKRKFIRNVFLIF